MRALHPLVAISLAAASVSCAPDPDGSPIAAASFDAGAQGSGGTAGADACTSRQPVPVDAAALPSCCSTGNAHCEARSNVAPSFAAQLASCAGGVCVPDPFLADPSYAPKACSSIGGAAGVCLSTCIPQIAQYGTLLPVDVCSDGDRCAPCISPIDQKVTGACELGKPGATVGCSGGPVPDAGKAADASSPPECPHAGPPVIDPTTLPVCGPGPGAHCLSASLVPVSEATLLGACPGGYCVPDAFIESGGEFIPPSCRAAGGVEGRCLNACLPSVANNLASLVISTCASSERCVPCFDPLEGTDTQACHLGCDPGPKDPETSYPTCCARASAPQPLGTCIPSALVPASQQASLATDTCDAGLALCVPDEQLAHMTPPPCTATATVGGAFTGVCLSACLTFDFLSSLGIAQGTCDDVHVCAPCVNPITRQPTGAPGCPP